MRLRLRLITQRPSRCPRPTPACTVVSGDSAVASRESESVAVGEAAEPSAVRVLGRPPPQRSARVTAHDFPPPRSSWELAGVVRGAAGYAGAGAGGDVVAKGETLALQVKRAGGGAAQLASANPLTCLAATATVTRGAGTAGGQREGPDSGKRTASSASSPPENECALSYVAGRLCVCSD